MPSLTPAEEGLMLQLWPLGTFYLKDAMAVQPEPKPHQNTISTYLKILVEKAYLTTEKEGRIFKYTIAVTFDDYKNAALDHFLKTYYDNEPKTLIADLKTRKILKDSDLETLVKPVEALSRPTPEGAAQVEKNHIREMLEELLEGKKKKKNKKKHDKGKK